MEGLLSQPELDPWIAKSLTDSSCEFVLSGYRPQLTFNGCTSSIFVLHNETINIWTHLVGAIVWVFMLQSTMKLLEQQGVDPVTLVLTRTTYWMCIAMPSASAAYHTYKCLDDYVCSILLSIDIVGIHLLMFARALMEGYLVFFCTPAYWLNFTMITAVFAVVLAAYGSYYRQQWPFIPAVLQAHVPLIWFLCTEYPHAVSDPQNESSLSLPSFRRYLLFSGSGSIVGVLAFLVFMYRMPECFWPGRFDLVGSSHQWWHVMTWLGPSLVLLGLLELTDARLTQNCALQT